MKLVDSELLDLISTYIESNTVYWLVDAFEAEYGFKMIREVPYLYYHKYDTSCKIVKYEKTCTSLKLVVLEDGDEWDIELTHKYTLRGIWE